MTTVSSTHVEGLYHRLTVTLPAAETEEDLAAKRRADPGRAPNDDAGTRAWDKLRQEAYRNALQQTDLRAVSEPEFVWVSAQGDEDYVFTATVEIMPTIDIGDLEQITIHQPDTTVTDEDVNHAVELLRDQNREFQTVERPARMEDRVVFDYMGTFDGNAFEGSAEQGASAVLGAGDALDAMENALVGRVAEETFALDITFPDDYQQPDLRGRCVRFDVVVKAVAEPCLPDPGPDFVKQMGVASGSLDELREQLRARLEDQCTQARQRYEQQQLSQALLDAVPVTVPETLLNRELEQLRDTIEPNGPGDDTPQETLPDEPLRATAQRRVALSLILSEVIRQRDLRLHDQRVEKKLDELAPRYGEPDAVKPRYRAHSQTMHNVKAKVMEEAGFESVMGTARKSSVSMSLNALLEAAG